MLFLGHWYDSTMTWFLGYPHSISEYSTFNFKAFHIPFQLYSRQLSQPLGHQGSCSGEDGTRKGWEDLSSYFKSPNRVFATALTPNILVSVVNTSNSKPTTCKD